MDKRPLIGITCSLEPARWSRYQQALNMPYTEAIRQCGGIPLIIPNGLDREELEELAGKLDGFLFSGGADVDPSRYGQEDEEGLAHTSPLRDETELQLFGLVYQQSNKPIFGICRGLQLINVALGGTLYLDLESAGKERHSFSGHPRDEFTHTIKVKDGTRLKRIMGDQDQVNSFHHQGIHRLADGLTVTAVSSDQVIEAFEAQGERYLLAVQWHPEELTKDPHHQELFAEFVRQAKR